MTTMRTILIALVGLALLAPATADAQTKQRKQARAHKGDKSGEMSRQRRDKIKQRIRAMREWKLTDALELDATTADKLFPILDSYDEKFVKVMRQGRKLRRQLRKQVESGNANDKQLDKIVDKMLSNQRAVWTLNEKRFKAARNVVAAEQAAKLLIVLPQIDHAIRRQMHKALDGGKGPFRGRKGRRRPRDFQDPF